MLRGFYESAAGMIAQQHRQEMLTNNLANANTPGFKADQGSLRTFPTLLMQALDTNDVPSGKGKQIGPLATGVYLQERMPNFRQGDLLETGSATDVALLDGVVPVNEAGERAALLFTVSNEQGDVRYTRNGNFAIDGQGYLVSTEGYYVLATNGERIQVGDENFRIADNGQITRSDGTAAGMLEVVVAEEPMLLVKEGNGLLRYTGEGELETAVGNAEVTYRFEQRFIERSNVDVAQTMAEMMSAYRTFEANQRVLQAYDQSLEKAVNEVGRIG